jgi:hypothetical protein
MGDVESALAAPGPGRDDAWRKELGQSLLVLSDALEWHISGTEGEDGLLAEILTTAPRLAHKIDQAHADHARIRAAIAAAAAGTDAGTDVVALRQDVVALLTDLVHHRQFGADLVYDAYNVDIEAVD